MREIAVMMNLLCGLLVLVSGTIYFKNTLKLNKINSPKEVNVQNILKAFDTDFFKYLPVAFISMTIPIFIKGTHLEAITEVFFPAVLITAAIESFHYLFKHWLTNKIRYIGYYKCLFIILLGIINGLSILEF
ncbi:hypothetical protein V2J23_17340 [Geobacillus thermoleovorans]|uniref:hypothetical protein n=1 Tax=Geobacillus thermoleovorans TaxID=33941 RepID=UPI00345C58FB